MRVIISDTAEEAGRAAAARISAIARATGPEVVLGLSTGSSPLATYQNLAQQVARGELDLSRARGFALDEYVGLPEGHPESYRAVIGRTVVEPLRMDPERVRVPNGFAEDAQEAAEEFEREIRAAGGIDVQLLGIGANGHIGFNEPGSSLASRTRPKALADATRRDNARFFDSFDDVPRRCITQGLGTILEARHVVLVATGRGKARAIEGLIEGPVTANCPASILQFHQRVTVVIDEPASSRLTNDRYYREAHGTGDRPVVVRPLDGARRH